MYVIALFLIRWKLLTVTAALYAKHLSRKFGQANRYLFHEARTILTGQIKYLTVQHTIYIGIIFHKSMNELCEENRRSYTGIKYTKKPRVPVADSEMRLGDNEMFFFF